MTRSYDYDDFIARRRRAMTPVIATMAARGRQVRRKPRTAEEREILQRVALERMRRRRETGEIVEIAPRLYELR